jgi:uncharacterized membrane protein
MDTIRPWIEWVTMGLDVLAVLVILAGVILATVKVGIFRALLRLGPSEGESRYKQQLGNGLLMGLDLLVASDVIRTVVLESTLYNVATLGLLVVVRILLTWSLAIELEGRLPWQAFPASDVGGATEHPRQTGDST